MLSIKIMWWVVVCLIGGSVAQTFQYSRGWTNGKRAQLSATREAACQLHKLRALIEGKPIPQAYFWCDLNGYLDTNRLGPPPSETEEQQPL